MIIVTPPTEQEATAEVERRRSYVASWIQNSLRPVDRLIKYDDFFPDAPTDTSDKTNPSSPEFEVREYQLDAWAALWDARQRGETRGLVHLATGLGKTSVAVFDVMKFRKEQLSQSPSILPRVLFVSHTNDISRQAEQRFRSFMPDLDFAYFNSAKNYLPMGHIDVDMTFATFQSLRNALHKFDPEDFEYIIYDEAHHIEAPTFKKVRDYFQPLFELALSATPDRLDDQDIREYFGEALYSKDLAEALSEGWLATPDYHIVFDDAVKEAMQSGFQANSLKALKELFDIKPRNDMIANNIREEMKKIGLEFGSVKTIVFCQDIEHAEEMAELLGGKAYHSETDSKNRRSVFDEFKNGDLQVITTRDMFNEGVDIPDARLLVFLRSTSSQTIFEQQLGRGLRKTDDKDRVSVLDFVANVERIAMVKDLADRIKKPRGTNTLGDDGEHLPTEDTLEPIEDGFAIRTNHGEFDFDTMVIDLLEKYSHLLELSSVRKEWQTLTNHELVDLALSLNSDAPLTARIIDKLSKQGVFPSATIIVSRFGSIVNFQKECGFDVRDTIDWSEYSNEDIISLATEISPDARLRRRQIENLFKQNLFPSSYVVITRFGSLSNFHIACGFEKIARNTARDWSSYTNQDLIDLALSLNPDSPLKQRDMNALSKEGAFPSKDYIVGIFGSIIEFHHACGFETRKKVDWSTYSNQELVDLALELGAGARLTTGDVRRLSKELKFPSNSLIQSRFGSLASLQEACGFPTLYAWDRYSDSELLSLGRALSPADGKLTQLEVNELYKQDKFPSKSYIVQRFGSFANFQTGLQET